MSDHQARNSCRGCTERHVGCHDNCPVYIAYRKRLEDERRMERVAMELYRYSMRLPKRRK